MQIRAEPLSEAEGIAIVIECENLDAGNAQRFKEQVQPYLDTQALVIIDMCAVRFVDSSGLGAMLACLRSMNNKQGQLKLVSLASPVRALFELVRMHRIFSIYDTREDALASL